MKKTNNKGFSLVELIIVIAIMAILAGAIAPALIRYIDKSRKSNDVSACKTIKTAVETAMGNEKTYELLTAGAVTNNTTNWVVITPGATSKAGVDIKVSSGGNITTDATNYEAKAEEEIFNNIGESVPKLKYKKAADSTIGLPQAFYVTTTAGGTVKVYIGKNALTQADFADDTKAYLISPDVCDYYQ